jgi:hypothetical protein
VDAGDVAIAVDWATYVTGSELTATLDINGGTALPPADYRFLVCGTTSIQDWAANAMDGDGNGTGGDDFQRNFTIAGNTAPVAVDDAYPATQGTTLNISAPGVLFSLTTRFCPSSALTHLPIVHTTERIFRTLRR